MKNLQTHYLKFHLCIPFFFLALSAFCQTGSLQKADSLFKAKKYTQSFQIYQSLLNQHSYSPAMLLKMAYIQEGLGHVGQSLYCLRLYELATHDKQAVEKMQELASKYNLTGYEETDTTRLYKWVDQRLPWMEGILVVILMAVISFIYMQKRKQQTARFAIAISVLIVLATLYVHNFLAIKPVITNQPKVYLMEGPSAGSSVEGIIADGNQLEVMGKEDVWLKVKWNDKLVFVKESNVLHVVL